MFEGGPERNPTLHGLRRPLRKGVVLKGVCGDPFFGSLGNLLGDSWATHGAVLAHFFAILSQLSQKGPKRESQKLPRGTPMS